MLAHDGDFFGPAVNLAARLVERRAPRVGGGERRARALLDPQRWVLTAEPPAALHGIDAPVIPYLVAPRA